jgi:spore germination cell wall hydrolase CwlJ-like protein
LRLGALSWRVLVLLGAAALPVATLGALFAQWAWAPKAMAQAEPREPRSPPALVLAFVGGQEQAVRDGRVVVDGVAIPVPPPARPGALVYLPLRRSAEADLVEAWQAIWARRHPVAVRVPVSRPVARPRPARAATRAASRSAAPPIRAVVPYSPGDVLLIARVVHAEADGQPFAAKLGVAAVVVNRVRAPGYPKTIPGVVYAPGQFQGVDSPLFADPPSPEDVQAALDALAGEDPTDGALHFYNPAEVWPGSPMFDLPVTATYGALRFAR